MLKLNLGAGTWPMPDYLNLDRTPTRPGVEWGEAYPLTGYANGSVDAIRASHLLEHFAEADVPKVLAEWARVLKIGGTLAIAVPDYDKLRAKPEKWDHFLMGGQGNPDDFHKSVFDVRKLTGLLEEAGFDKIEPWTSEQKDCADYPISLNLRGTKARDIQQYNNIKIGALMSVPRLGYNAARFAIEKALHPFGIPVTQFTSAYWHQSLEDAIEEAVSRGSDWVITFDYDTMVTSSMLRRMFEIFATNPHMDALSALQPKRGDGTPLLTAIDDNGKAIIGDIELTGPIRCSSAHFGCTLLRLKALEGMEKPWFLPIPGPDGRWKKGHIDADIEFWHRWARAGRSLYVDPFTSIGHLETLVMWLNPEGKLEHLQVKDWRERNPND